MPYDSGLAPVRAKWIMFHPLPQGKRKTRIWHVTTIGNHPVDLGEIRWHAPWRQYAFFPDPNTLFEPKCLGDLASFMSGQTKARRETVKDPSIPRAWRPANPDSNPTLGAYENG